MNIVKLQDIKSTHRNLLHSYTLTMRQIGKDPDAGRDWGQEEKGTTKDEMAGWHHQLNGHEFE